MKKGLLNRINSVRARRTVSFVLALALCLSFGNRFEVKGDDLPAAEPVCGLAEHIHGETCRETVCGLPETEAHTHGEGCYESVLVCTDVSPEHVHGDGCMQSVLSCALPEGEGHTHSESCYKKVLICENMSPEHIHGELCYDYVYICGLEENTHVPECEVMPASAQEQDYSEVFCGMAEHIHDGSCYEWICNMQDSDPTHVHSVDTCAYQLICALSEHVHSWKCYISPDAPLICGKEEHIHSDSCGYWSCTEIMPHEHRIEYGCTWNPVCLKEEHIHGPECYGAPGTNIYGCGLEEHTHGPECYETVYLCGITDPWHVHDETCPSEQRLICAKKEHTHDFTCEVMRDSVTSNTHLYIVTADGNLLPVDNYKDPNTPYTIVKEDIIKVAADASIGNHITVADNQDGNGKILNPPNNNWDATDDPMPGFISRYFEGNFVYEQPCKVFLQKDSVDVSGEYFYVKVLEPEDTLYVQTPTGLKTVDEATNALTFKGIPNDDYNNPYPMKFGDTITVKYYDYGTEQTFATWDIMSGDYNEPANDRIRQKGEVVRTANSVTATFEAVGSGVARIALGGKNGKYYDISLQITGGPDEAKIYIDNMMIGTKSYEKIDRHTATKMLLGWTDSNYNSETKRLIVYVGQQIDLTCEYDSSQYVTTVGGNDIYSTFISPTGDGKDSQGNIIQTNTKRLVRTNHNNPGLSGVQAGFFGLNTGECEVQVKTKNYEGPSIESLFIDVQYPIYVETAIGEIHKDRIHEYLNFVNDHLDDSAYITDKRGNRLYLKNDGIIDNGEYGLRYVMSDEDVVTLVSYSTNPDDRFICDGTVMKSNGDRNVEMKTIRDDASGNEYFYYRISESFTANNDNNNDYEDASHSKDNDEYTKISFNNQDFYIAVVPDYSKDQIKAHSQYDNHFDIEVSDGGKYVLTKTFDDGHVEKITYEAMVHSVNSCKVWSREEYEKLDANKEHIGVPLWTLTQDDYWRHTTESATEGTQNEYTSAYNKVDGQFQAGNPTTREISHGQVYKVIFDLDLELKPLTIEKSTNGVDFEPAEDISNEPSEIRQGIAVVMESREILDAYNKCPDHSGLDFTLSDRILAAQATPTASKQYFGTSGEITTGERDKFLFDIYDSNPLRYEDAVKLRTATVLDGKIQFNPVEFADVDDFTYYVREVRPNTPDGITYDDRVLRIKFTTSIHTDTLWVDTIEYTFFKKDESGNLVQVGDKIVKNLTGGASGEAFEPPTFINYAPFELPVTGGGGAGGLHALGVGLLITGFILMPKGRRRARPVCSRGKARAGDQK